MSVLLISPRNFSCPFGMNYLNAPFLIYIIVISNGISILHQKIKIRFNFHINGTLEDYTSCSLDRHNANQKEWCVLTRAEGGIHTPRCIPCLLHLTRFTDHMSLNHVNISDVSVLWGLYITPCICHVDYYIWYHLKTLPVGLSVVRPCVFHPVLCLKLRVKSTTIAKLRLSHTAELHACLHIHTYSSVARSLDPTWHARAAIPWDISWLLSIPRTLLCKT